MYLCFGRFKSQWWKDNVVIKPVECAMGVIISSISDLFRYKLHESLPTTGFSTRYAQCLDSELEGYRVYIYKAAGKWLSWSRSRGGCSKIEGKKSAGGTERQVGKRNQLL